MELEICRSSGDGMEDEETNKESLSLKPLQDKPIVSKQKIKNKVPGQYTLYRPSENESTYLSPVIPKGKLYCLIPKLIKSKNTTQSTKIRKNREPRFIPIEPYKGAVKPILPLKKHKNVIKKEKNNVDINFLVSQMSNMKTSELQNLSLSKIYNPNLNAKSKDIDEEKQKLLTENEELRKEKDQINNQLKFQLQVNAELKNLLVASVGEDLQTKVNVLTEDKLQLANNLSTHTEQIEFLAGQCEVWRSKFLASSVMIEELAKWKADLLQKNAFLMESNKRNLQLISKIREMQIDILKNLKFLANLKHLNLPSSDIISLCSESLNITQQMVLHSEHSGVPGNLKLNDLDVLTDIEKFAIKALKNINQPLTATDQASKAIVEQAFSSKSTNHDSINTVVNENLSI